MPLIIFSCPGGSIACPDKVLCDRTDGGHLIVSPSRPVWERSCLKPDELVLWSLLIAATGRAMLEVLPVLQDGCVNYWEAGNWALNDLADPPGPKDVQAFRRVHLHIFGRSRNAHDPEWRWGESPKFPDYDKSGLWAKRFSPLLATECQQVAERVDALLKTTYIAPVFKEYIA